MRKIVALWLVFSFLVTGIFSQNTMIFGAETQDIEEVNENGMSFSKKVESISVDGKLEEAFWDMNRYLVENITEGNVEDANNKVSFNTAWDDKNFYIGTKVLDAAIVNNKYSADQLWQDDTIEIFISSDNNKKPGYSVDKDHQIFVRVDDLKVYSVTGSSLTTLSEKVDGAKNVIEGGYTLELAIPWESIDIIPTKGMVIGFDLANDDSDKVGEPNGRINAYTWNNKLGNNYATTVNFGEMMLIEKEQPVISTEGSPLIDGDVTEAIWQLTKTFEADNNKISFGSLSDQEALYIGVDVADDTIKTDSESTYLDDSIEIFIDGNNSKSVTYDAFDRQFSLSLNKSLSAGANQSMEGVQSQIIKTETGYSVELAIPWSNLGIVPQHHMSIGFDVVNTDDDQGGSADIVWGAWSGKSNNWESTANFGDLLISNMNVTKIEKPEYTGPRGTVTDSAEDLDKVYESKEIFVAGIDDENADFGETIYRTWNEGAYLLYKSPEGSIVSFSMEAIERNYAANPAFRVLGSNDGITFKEIKLEAEQIDVKDGWIFKNQYKTSRFDEEFQYIKIEYLFSDAHSAGISNVSFDYKLDYSGKTIVVEDVAENFDKIHEYANIYTAADQGFGISKFHTWTDNAYMVYASPSGSILSFAVETVEANSAPVPSFKFYVSSDNIRYQEIKVESKELAVEDGWRFKKLYDVPELEWGMKYIKIESLAASNGWAAGISKVTYESVLENNAPSVDSDIHAVTQMNKTVLGTINATDVDGDALTYTLLTSPLQATTTVKLDKNTGKWLYTPNRDFVGDDSFTVEIMDEQGAKSLTEVHIFVNYAPTKTTYYVSALKGSDSNTGLSSKKPFSTVQKAHDMSKPGDTIYIMNGTYGQTSGEGVVNITRSGLPEAYITYKAYPNHHPVFTVKDAWNHIRVTGAAYIKIEGIIIKGNQETITKDQAMDVYDYMVGLSDENKWDEADWAYIGTTNTNGISIASNGDKFSHHIEIRNMDISSCPGGGIGSSYADYIVIENNKVYDNCKWGAYGGSGISLYNQSNYDFLTTKYKNIIRGNISFNNVHLIPWFTTKTMSDGNGIIIDDNKNEQREGASAYNGWTLVEKNLTYGNGGSGIHAYSSSNVDIIYNTSYMNNVTPELKWGEIFASASDNVNILNNILYGRGSKLNETYENKNVIYDRNCYFNGTTLIQGEKDIVADPIFVNAKNGDFRLKNNSPANGKGFTGPVTYTIVSGDKLWKIARKYGTTIKDLVEWNKDTIKNPDLIYAGQKIFLP